jgi:hypothetical protein
MTGLSTTPAGVRELAANEVVSMSRVHNSPVSKPITFYMYVIDLKPHLQSDGGVGICIKK